MKTYLTISWSSRSQEECRIIQFNLRFCEKGKKIFKILSLQRLSQKNWRIGGLYRDRASASARVSRQGPLIRLFLRKTVLRVYGFQMLESELSFKNIIRCRRLSLRRVTQSLY